MRHFLPTAISSVVRRSAARALKTTVKDERIRKQWVVAWVNLRHILSQERKASSASIHPESVLAQTSFPCIEHYRGNSFYGIGAALQNYAGHDNPLQACIEHGVYFGDYVDPLETSHSGLPGTVTVSQIRRQHISTRTTKPSFAVGPYIHYVPSTVQPNKSSHKTLLVFPVHSIDNVTASFDTSWLLDTIAATAKERHCDRVLVCLYWKDFALGRAHHYSTAGYGVVTAGRREDPDFLLRLRHFIETSDYTMSNDVGTHIGYCVYLGKPHYLVQQPVRYRGVLQADLTAEVSKTSSPLRDIERKIVANAFVEQTETLTPRQWDVCRQFWGVR